MHKIQTPHKNWKENLFFPLEQNQPISYIHATNAEKHLTFEKKKSREEIRSDDITLLRRYIVFCHCFANGEWLAALTHTCCNCYFREILRGMMETEYENEIIAEAVLWIALFTRAQDGTILYASNYTFHFVKVRLQHAFFFTFCHRLVLQKSKHTIARKFDSSKKE